MAPASFFMELICLKNWLKSAKKALFLQTKGGWRGTIEGRGEGKKYLTTIPRKSTAGQAVTKEHEGI
jgi:hypothetical protein